MKIVPVIAFFCLAVFWAGFFFWVGLFIGRGIHELSRDRPVILGQFRTERGKYERMKLGIELGYKWVEAVPSDIDEGGARVIIGHTTATGRNQSTNETLGQPAP